MSIKIPISAELNDGDLKSQLNQIRAAFNALGAEAQKAGNLKFNPISKASVEEARRMRQEFEAMLRVSGGLRRTLEGAGQGGKQWHAIDWQRVFPDANQRQNYARTLLNRLRGGSLEDAHTPEPPAPPEHRQPPAPGHASSSASAIVSGIAQAGLRGAGPVGSVAASALGTGMQAGFGAGLAGLLGGLGALAAGKLASGVANKVGDAQDEAIAYDRLKRSLGDVNVSFEALRSTVREAAGDIGVTFNEAVKLGSEFTRLGNFTAEQDKEVSSGVAFSGGLARAFGLDPSQTVTLLGTMRGIRQTGADQDTRKLGLLIGETIARSNAFAKSDEVMDALAGFVTQQARNSLGRAPVEGYARIYAGLVGSGIPGLDPSSAAGLLNRALTTLSQGGGKGEASHFFSARVALRAGLDNPIAGRIWGQNPMATIDQAFAPDSAVGRYLSQNGIVLPTGGAGSFYSRSIGQLTSDYQDPWLRLSAAANHFGVNESQAAALLGVAPAQLGGLERRLGRLGVGLTSVNASGISTLGQIESADRSGLGRIADELLGRRGNGALTSDEARDLKAALSGGNDEVLRDVLATLTASRGQIETEGSKTRDTIAATGNIMQEYASKAIPILNDSRAALMLMAGKQLGLGPQGIRDTMVKAESIERAEAIKGKYGALIDEQDQRIVDARMSEQNGSTGAAYAEAVERSRNIQADASTKIKDLERRRDEDLRLEEERYKRELRESRESVAKEREAVDKARTAAASAALPSTGAGVGGTLLDSVIAQESRGRHYGANGQLLRSSAGARGIAQIMPATGRNPGYGVRPLQDDSEAEHRRFASDYLGAMLREFDGDKSKALAAYNAGPGAVQKAVRRYGGQWLRHMPAETQNYVPEVLERERRSQGTPLPSEAQTREQARREPLAYSDLSGQMQVHLDLSAEARRLLQEPITPLSTRVGPARPFGMPA